MTAADQEQVERILQATTDAIVKHVGQAIADADARNALYKSQHETALISAKRLMRIVAGLTVINILVHLWRC